MEKVAFLFSNAFHVYVVFRFARKIFLTYPKYQIALMAAIGYYVLNSFCALYFGIPILNLISSVVGLFLLVMPCSDRWIKRIFFVVLITSIGYVCDVLIYTVFNNPGYLLSIGVITNFILLVVELGLEAIFFGKFKSDFGKKEWMILCSVPVGSIFVLFILDMDHGTSQGLCLICAIVCLLINIIIFRFYDTLSSYYDQILIAHQNDYHLKMYENKIVAVEAIEKQMNSFRHDLNNHISALKEMARDGNNLNIVSFLDNMSDSLFVKNNAVFTRHKDFNLLVNYLYDKAVLNGLNPVIDIDIPITLQCNIYDMNIILSNLFDNAIEAALVTNDKIIKLSIKYKKGIFCIKISNSHNNIIKKNNKLLATTKLNSDLHGYGLKNTKRIVEKYHGSLEYKYDNHMFFTTVIVFI